MELAFDVETTGLKRSDRIFSYSLTTPTGKTQIYRTLDPGFLERLKDLFQPNGPHLVMHNASFDLGMVGRLLKKPVWRWVNFHDTMVLSHLLRNDHYSHSLEDLAYDFCGYPKIDKEIHGLAKKLGGMHRVPREEMNRYQTADGERTMILFRAFWDLLQERREGPKIYAMELEVIRVSLDMERRGIKLLRSETADLVEELKEKCARIKKELQERTWEGFNPRSVTDRRKLLYSAYGLKSPSRKTSRGEDTTDKSALLHWIEYGNLPEWRRKTLELLVKHGSYHYGLPIIQSYLDLAGEDDIIHPRIRTLAAVTGRQSCTKPNLQNVAKEGVLLNPYAIPARKCFGPRPGYVNLHIDYSGIEMRLLVHYSGDPGMVECLDRDIDPHDVVTHLFYQVKRNHPQWKELRGAAKNANFAIPYGASPAKVIQTLGLGNREGRAAFLRYQEAFPGLCGLSRTTAQEVYQTRGVTTAFGRFLRVPKREAYIGTNYKIQGTGAEILKEAEVRIARLHRSRFDGVHLLLPIHDELVIEYPANAMDDLGEYLLAIKSAMTDFPGLRVPLQIGVEIAVDNWADKKEIQLLDTGKWSLKTAEK